MNTTRNLVRICLLSAVLLQVITGGAQPVTQVTAGDYHSLFLKSDGSLWAMGYDKYGQLGDGTNNFVGTNQPEMIVASNVTAIAAGPYHSLFLKSDGSLWGMGANNNYIDGGPSGQLGDGTYNDTNRPEMIVAAGVTAIAAGGFHSLFLKSDGSLWAMGYNAEGQLGDGTYNTTNRPEMIVASNVTAIAAGLYYSLFLKSDGSLWAMGDDSNGQLGDGLDYELGSYSTNQPEMIVASNVTAISAGQFHSLFIKSDGSLWGMGYNQSGVLGGGYVFYIIPQPELIVASNVTRVLAGYVTSMFLESGGSLFGMGENSVGQLGDGTYNDTGTNLPELIVASGVTAMAAGFGHSLVTKSDGSLWATGENVYGQLGDGTTNNDNGNYSTNQLEEIVAGPPGYNQISGQFLSGGKLGLYYMGMTGTNYELDHSFSLSPANWIPQATNPAGTDGVLVFTNSPSATSNNFWRIRSVP